MAVVAAPQRWPLSFRQVNVARPDVNESRKRCLLKAFLVANRIGFKIGTTTEQLRKLALAVKHGKL